ncbi:hypothetical protein CROQUDRAFT_40669 [Cronartium quercuum f. sp. fusiforme G11]|uniref:Dynactin subunit 4 n=1 Tax=Cronartium quercuum f. sp. fusiforme G11 TaxID=708437 RepID=A0A9P6TEI9_9BASI|nr:hypothetical protein CROQUDRAFT_40669 [Cronartium quercuum f. sp. fusiforme G11]
MSTSVHYLCPHTAPISSTPPDFEPHSTSSPSVPHPSHYHSLSSLFFCEECDAIRCDQCVNCELNCYYCPNCLFEVPSANIRAQKNRCGRNCFLCPQCQNTLAAVASDPPPSTYDNDPKAPQASIGEAPYFLTCTFCRWDSKQVGIFFEKPTFLAQQLQHTDSNAPELTEFDQLKDHFETYLKSQTVHSPGIPQSHSRGLASSSSSAQLAASLALSKEVPQVTRYGTQLGLPSSVFKIRSTHSLMPPSSSSLNMSTGAGSKEDRLVYDAIFPTGGTTETRDSVQARDKARYDLYRRGLRDRYGELSSTPLDADHFAPLCTRWEEAWESLDLTKDLRPARIPLRSKRTKRCPTCEHILIKPEQKAQSIRFKIKLVASNYLPLIELARKRLMSKNLVADRLTSSASAARKNASRPGSTTGSNPLLGRVGDVVDEVIRADRKYQFELTFVNPLYEPINVRLSIIQPKPIALIDGAPAQVPYAVHILAPEFTIAAFAEVWEYDEDEENEGNNNELDDGYDAMDADENGTTKRSRLSTFGITDSMRRRTLQANPVVTRRANRTTVLVETKTCKEFVGTLQADMLVTFTYRSDEFEEDLDDSLHSHHTRKKKPASQLTEDEDEDEHQKSFAFWTKLTFGEVLPVPTLQPSSSVGIGLQKKRIEI